MAELVLDLAGTVSGVGVKTSYGEAVDIDGTKVIPVALGAYSFGGGGGTTDADAGTSATGGGSRELHGQGSGGGRRASRRQSRDSQRFLRPSELAAWCRAASLDPVATRGLEYNPLTRRYRLSAYTSVNYLVACRKAT